MQYFYNNCNERKQEKTNSFILYLKAGTAFLIGQKLI